MADLLRNQLDVEVGLESGGFGEFTVLAGDQVLRRRTGIALPSDESILEAVRSHLKAGETPAE